MRETSGMRRWRRLLRAEPTLACVVGFLASSEAVCLLVAALEAQHEGLVRFLYAHERLLALGDASRRYTSVLHCAAAYGRAHVVQWLLRFRMSHPDVLGLATAPRPPPSPRPRPQRGCKSERVRELAWISRNCAYDFPPEVMYEAARQGDQEVVEWLHSVCPQYQPHRAMEYAASCGQLEVVMWLYQQHQLSLQRPIAAESLAAHNQELEQEQPVTEHDVTIYMVQPLDAELQVVNWVAVFPRQRFFREAFASRAGFLAAVYDQRDPLLPWDQGARALRATLGCRRYRALDMAAAQGNLALVQKLHHDGRWPCTSLAMDMAATNGHLKVVEFLHEHRREGGTAVALCSAAGNGHLDVVKWLHRHRSNDGCRSLVLDVAATNGHLDVLRWLAKEFPRFSCSPTFLPSVAARGHFETLQYLHEKKGIALDSRTLEAAIGSGNLPLVQYVAQRVPVERRRSLSPYVAERAAQSGNMELVTFVVDTLGLWSPRMLAAAAMSGNLELVRWVLSRTDLRPQRKTDSQTATTATTPTLVRGRSATTMDTSVLRSVTQRRSSVATLPMTTGGARPLDIVDGATLFRCASMDYNALVEWLLKHGLAEPSFTLSSKERELVLRSVVGQGILDVGANASIPTSNTRKNDGSASLFGATGNTTVKPEPLNPPSCTATAAALATDNGVYPAIRDASTGVGDTGWPGLDGKKTQLKPHAWALRSKSSPGWQRRFVRLAVQYYPESALSLDWIPLWAAQRGELFVLQRLADVNHPQLFVKSTYLALLRYTKAGDVLQWFHTHSPTAFGDSAVVAWGVKYRLFAFLTFVFLQYQPVRAEARFRQHGVEYALHAACAMGHLDVVTWICASCEIFLDFPASEMLVRLGRLAVWNDAVLAAARCGQVAVLRWLHAKFSFFRNVPDSPRKVALVGDLADAAAAHGQRRVLLWLSATVGPQMLPPTREAPEDRRMETKTQIKTQRHLTSFVSSAGLKEAMAKRHVDVVQWLCGADTELVARQTPKRREELVAFLREQVDGFVPTTMSLVFPPL